jgi:hypothetical protein
LKRENEEDSDVIEPVNSFQPLLHPFIPKPVIHKNILKAGAGAVCLLKRNTELLLINTESLLINF